MFKRHATLLWGLAVTLLFLGLALGRSRLLDTMELALFDLKTEFAAPGSPGTSGSSGSPGSPGAGDALTLAEQGIVLVDIDEASLKELGRWPWPRSYLAQGLSIIQAGGPRAVGLNIHFAEPERDPGLLVLRQLEALFNQVGLGKAENGPFFLQRMKVFMTALEGDLALARAINATSAAVLPLALAPDASLLAAGAAPPPPERLTLPLPADLPFVPPSAGLAELPIPLLLETAHAGHINRVPDADGKVRRDQLFYRLKDRLVPSFSLRLAAAAMDRNASLQDVLRFGPGETVTLGSVSIPVSDQGAMLMRFPAKGGRVRRVSYFDVVSGVTPAAIFKEKIVLVGFSAGGLADLVPGPLGRTLSPGEFTVHAVATLLSGFTFHQPGWSRAFQAAVILVNGLLLSLALPRLRALPALGVFLGLVTTLSLGSTLILIHLGVWVETMHALVHLAVGFLGLASLRFFVTEAGKDRAEGESAESNRMLGLSFQSQGLLDLAFDKFRKAPVDEGLKEILYGLAQDFERKRQFGKAAQVYEYLEQHDPAFRDATQRRKRMLQLGETMVVGEGMLNLTSVEGGEKPTLGRYEVQRMLGRGAMGVVYLGRDPRINRTVAIKTFSFAGDIPADELEDMKKKFFVEAESAGTLSHPHIVTIHDAGEEQDLAYIAMEYLQGADLSRHTKPPHLLPVRDVAALAADVADALDYAHAKGVVHRDIKPANLMLLETGVVKVTDFGVARIADASRTRTGVVKGTPNYMSPEQISGKKVDGRSDIFSLGVVLFQLLTGRLPFEAENVATLMHKILHEDPADPRLLNPEIPKPLAQVIFKALAKTLEARYQKAGEMAGHLRRIVLWIDQGGASQASPGQASPGQANQDQTNPDQASQDQANQEKAGDAITPTPDQTP